MRDPKCGCRGSHGCARDRGVRDTVRRARLQQDADPGALPQAADDEHGHVRDPGVSLGEVEDWGKSLNVRSNRLKMRVRVSHLKGKPDPGALPKAPDDEHGQIDGAGVEAHAQQVAQRGDHDGRLAPVPPGQPRGRQRGQRRCGCRNRSVSLPVCNLMV